MPYGDGDSKQGSQVPVSSHRLPTVSASAALQAIRTTQPNNIPLGLTKLDRLLQPQYYASQSDYVGLSGLGRGQVIDIWGPPGVGKTTLCLQACVSALLSGSDVLWIDGHSTVAGPRLKQVLEHQIHAVSGQDSAHDGRDEEKTSPEHYLKAFTHLNIPSLAHFLALIVAPAAVFPNKGTSLIVVDGLTTVLDAAYSRTVDDRRFGQMSGQRGFGNRRTAVLVDIASKLAKLAATRNVAVLVTNDCVTKIRKGFATTLRPAMEGNGWELSVPTRITLFRGWLPPSSRKDVPRAVRYASVSRNGRRVNRTEVIALLINNGGFEEIATVPDTALAFTSEQGARKRKATHHTGREAEDEDNVNSGSEYGWDEDEEASLIAEVLLSQSEPESQADAGRVV